LSPSKRNTRIAKYFLPDNTLYIGTVKGNE
jgi:hypothetical protein